LRAPASKAVRRLYECPTALEANMQKATDLGAVGIIVPTVDDALRSARRRTLRTLSSHRPAKFRGRRFGQAWPGVNYRATINDNMLVVVMIETLEGVANAEEIAATAGIDVIILGNNDLSSFSGWSQNDPRYQDAVIKVHNAALKYGKFSETPASNTVPAITVSADTRMIQDGPARDGWTPPRGGGGARGAAPAAGGRGNAAPAAEEAEPVIGLPRSASHGDSHSS
jgi:2-keto-3-deoxy-L-rhamnonate aldolase RhmA